jgi:hypothetical protein
MFDFIVGMVFGSLLTSVPLLVWERLARSKATKAAAGVPELRWNAPRRK